MELIVLMDKVCVLIIKGVLCSVELKELYFIFIRWWILGIGVIFSWVLVINVSVFFDFVKIWVRLKWVMLLLKMWCKL